MEEIGLAIYEWLDAIEHSAFAKGLGFSKWGYASVNAAHILGVAMLVGSILPMDLRLMGAWPRVVGRDQLARILLPVAITGLVLAAVAGVLLFVVHAPDYGTNGVFQTKMVVVIVGVTAALVFHARAGRWIEQATPSQARAHGIISLSCWLGALVLGRMIAYSQL